MNLTLFILLLFGLQGICLYVGGKASKGMKDNKDYFLAGKGIRFFPLMMTFLATQVGGGIVLGSAEEAYKYGWAVLFYPLGATCGLILLGLGIGKKLSKFQVSTVAQIFETVYKSPTLKKIASLLSITSLFMILVAQFIASDKFMTSLGVENKIWFIAFWAIVILYTAIGGLKAVVATDIIQAGFFILVFLLSFVYASFFSDVPMTGILEKSSGNFDILSTKLTGWLFMPLLFMVVEQDMAQRCFASNSGKEVSKATLWAGILTIFISLVPVFFGILAKSMDLAIPKDGSVLMTVIQKTTSPWITACVSCAILAAIISTADSLINAISSNLAQDFGGSIFKKNTIRSSQILSAVIASLGVFFSFYFNNIVDMLIQSYELSVSCLFAPIMFALFKKEGNKLAASLSLIFGAASFFLFRFINPSFFPKELLSIVISFAGYGIGEWFARKNEPLFTIESK